MIQEALGIIQPNDDLLHNHVASVADIEKIIAAANGLPCLY
jgi:hypothetical protein